MSKTDKDAPYWVRAMHATNSTERHHRCQHDPRNPAHATTFDPFESRECDIDTRHGTCTRHAASVQPRHEAPSKIDRRLYYHKPSRAQARTELDAARHEYNTTGTVDGLALTTPHRHSPFRGGWWD